MVDTRCTCILYSDGYRVMDEHGRVLATLCRHGDELASLWTAAPELYDACQRLLSQRCRAHCIWSDPCVVDEHGPKPHQHHVEQCEADRALLARARGEEAS